jgi:hypothetical protein
VLPEQDLQEVRLEQPAQKIKRVYLGPAVAFVPHPHLRGAWVKTHPCVVLVSCPHCDSPKGFLCLGSQGFGVTVHYKRIHAAAPFIKHGRYVLPEDVL